MRKMTSDNRASKTARSIGLSLVAGLAIGAMGSQAWSDHRGPHPDATLIAAAEDPQMSDEVAPPSEHKGLTVVSLGVIPAASLEQQLGLGGHKLQLREITIAPGGQIATHSHETRPGLVKVISGTWTEGRPAGETPYGSDAGEAILEDESTVHWFWNRGDRPATAIVCDIVPEG